jgi:uncharacterized membrane protein HdeD (DUF308 family)
MGASGGLQGDTGDVVMNSAGSAMTDVEAQAVASEIGRWWWAWIVVGVLWILASFVILQFGKASVSTVGIIIGVMLLVAGVQEFAVGAFAGGWKWLWYIFGALFIVGGLWALFNPQQTFLAAPARWVSSSCSSACSGSSRRSRRRI